MPRYFKQFYNSIFFLLSLSVCIRKVFHSFINFLKDFYNNCMSVLSFFFSSFFLYQKIGSNYLFRGDQKKAGAKFFFGVKICGKNLQGNTKFWFNRYIT